MDFVQYSIVLSGRFLTVCTRKGSLGYKRKWEVYKFKRDSYRGSGA